MRGQRAISAFAPALMSENITQPEDLKVGDVVICVRQGSGLIAQKTYMVDRTSVGSNPRNAHEIARFRRLSGMGEIHDAYVSRVKKI